MTGSARVRKPCSGQKGAKPFTSTKIGGAPAARWSAYVHPMPEEAEWAAIRRGNQTGLPYGESRRVDRPCGKLNLDSPIRPRGRPRKEVRDNKSFWGRTGDAASYFHADTLESFWVVLRYEVCASSQDVSLRVSAGTRPRRACSLSCMFAVPPPPFPSAGRSTAPSRCGDGNQWCPLVCRSLWKLFCPIESQSKNRQVAASKQ